MTVVFDLALLLLSDESFFSGRLTPNECRKRVESTKPSGPHFLSRSLREQCHQWFMNYYKFYTIIYTDPNGHNAQLQFVKTRVYFVLTGNKDIR